MNYLKFFNDTETTGVDERIHQIHQIGLILTDPTTNTILETADIKMRIDEKFIVHADADGMAKSNVTIDQIMANPYSQKEGYDYLISILEKHINRYDRADKAQFIAYNSPFDERFIRQLFLNQNDNYFGSWFWNPTICVMRAAAWFVQEHRGDFPNFRLETLCRIAGIEFDEEKAHDGFYDIEKTIEFYRFLTQKTT